MSGKRKETHTKKKTKRLSLSHKTLAHPPPQQDPNKHKRKREKLERKKSKKVEKGLTKPQPPQVRDFHFPAVTKTRAIHPIHYIKTV